MVEISLSENSPLLISLCISGQEQNIFFILRLLLRIADIPQDKIETLVPVNKELKHDVNFTSAFDVIFFEADELISECNYIGVKLFLMEYFLSNCHICNTRGIKSFYRNYRSDEDDKFPLLLN
jgi:hypothetical protein